jgi:hypothetical protein
MRNRFQDSEHLIRAAILLCVGLAAFLALRTFLVPGDFGTLGHYRESALVDNRAQAVSYAGQRLCEECHADVGESRVESKHARVACEACHGALAGHAEDPTAVAPAKLPPEDLCLTCHAFNLARPASFPQVKRDEHSGGEACSSCHAPHHPEVE